MSNRTDDGQTTTEKSVKWTSETKESNYCLEDTRTQFRSSKRGNMLAKSDMMFRKSDSENGRPKQVGSGVRLKEK